MLQKKNLKKHKKSPTILWPLLHLHKNALNLAHLGKKASMNLIFIYVCTCFYNVCIGSMSSFWSSSLAIFLIVAISKFFSYFVLYFYIDYKYCIAVNYRFCYTKNVYLSSYWNYKFVLSTGFFIQGLMDVMLAGLLASKL